MKSDHIEGGLPSNLELTAENRLLFDRTLEIPQLQPTRFCVWQFAQLSMLQARKYLQRGGIEVNQSFEIPIVKKEWC